MLREYFDQTKDNYSEQDPVTKKFDERYLYLQTRLRACRYDYQVQKLVDKHYAKALLTNVQAAVLAGDRKEFDTVWPECFRAFQETKSGNITRLCVFKLLWNFLDFGVANLGRIFGREDVGRAERLGVDVLALTKVVDQLVNSQPVQTEEEDRYVRRLLGRLERRLG